MRLGLYIASHNNPVFLRNALLQLEAQTMLPNAVAVHENGHEEAARTKRMCDEVIARLHSKGVDFRFDHSPVSLGHPFHHYLPLKRLVEELPCDYYTKWDHDDIFYEDHLKNLSRAAHTIIRTGFAQTVQFEARRDWAGFSQADVLILNPKAYVYRPDLNFGVFNPLGGMSDCFMFSHRVAEQYLKHMLSRAGKNEADDYILQMYTLPLFPYGGVFKHTPTACYVSHGRNDSTAHWVRQTPEEIR